jgi:hypothetical protein
MENLLNPPKVGRQTIWSLCSRMLARHPPVGAREPIDGANATEAPPAERLFVAPHAPGFLVADLPDDAGLARFEQTYRRLGSQLAVSD